MKISFDVWDLVFFIEIYNLIYMNMKSIFSGKIAKFVKIYRENLLLIFS